VVRRICRWSLLQTYLRREGDVLSPFGNILAEKGLGEERKDLGASTLNLDEQVGGPLKTVDERVFKTQTG